VAAYINAHGGIAGRHLNVVYFRGLDKPVSSSAQGVSACDFFTETNHVLAVLDPGSPPASAMVTCLAAHNTPLVTANDAVPNQAYFNQYRNIYYSPEGMALNQIAVSYVQGLKSEGFFGSPGAKYGVITANVPLWETVTKTNLLPALSKIGVKPLAVEYVADREAAAARSEAQTQVSAMSEVTKVAIEAVQKVTTTQMDAVREASNARVEAAKGEATFFRSMFEQLLGVSNQARQQAAPAQQADPVATATSLIQGLGGLLQATQGIAGAQQVDPRIQAQADSTRATGEGMKTFLDQAGGALHQAAKELMPGIKGLFRDKPSADPDGSRNGIPNTPPPPPQ
jgi:hypothetical protein